MSAPSGVARKSPLYTSAVKSRSASLAARSGFTKRGVPIIPSVSAQLARGTSTRKKLFACATSAKADAVRSPANKPNSIRSVLEKAARAASSRPKNGTVTRRVRNLEIVLNTRIRIYEQYESANVYENFRTKLSVRQLPKGKTKWR